MFANSLLHKPWLCCLTSLLLGSSLVFTFAPFNLYLLTPWVIACFYLLCKYSIANLSKKKHQFLLGWCFGFGLFAAGCYWIFISIYYYSQAGFFISLLIVVLLYMVLALFYGGWVLIFAVLVKKCDFIRLKDKFNFSEPVLFASLFVLFEYGRGWILGGFPWLYLGYSQSDSSLAGYATVFGVLGIDWFLVFIAALLGQICSSWYAIRARATVISVALISIVLICLLGYALKSISWTQIDTSKPPLRFISVQPNIAQDMKWSKQQEALIRKTLVNLSLTGLSNLEASKKSIKSALVDSPVVILWPEAALPSYWGEEKAFLTDFVYSLPANSWLLTGIIAMQKQDWLNSIALLNNHVLLNNHLISGGKEQFYHKRKLVPFGEFIPLMNWLVPLTEWLGFHFPVSDLKSGADEQPNLQIGNYRIAAFICYEIIFSDLVTKSLKDSNYLLTISNDAWFGKSIGPYQHMQIASMRALENGLPLIRVTNTGISVVIDHKGKIIQSLAAYVPAVGHYSLAPVKGNTPFHYVGSWAIVFFSLLCPSLLILVNRFYAKKP